MHTVEVDRDAELAALAKFAEQAEAHERESAAEEQAAAHEAAGHDPDAWRKASDFVCEVFAGQVVPGWSLESADKEQLSAALAEVLDHYWPGGPNGIENWHPLYKLVFVAGSITLTRGIDWSTGRLKPTRPPKALEGPKHGESEAERRESPIPSGHDAERQNGSRFTLGGGRQ